MLLPCGLKLNVTPVKSTEIPSEELLLQAGRELIQESSNWAPSKNKGAVKVYSAPKQADDEAPWFCRSSVHSSDEASFDELWFGLGTKKPEHERRFVKNIDNIVLLKRISERAEIWNLHYKFTPPISDRTFTVLQVVQLDTSDTGKSGIIVSIPIDTSPDEDMSKAELKGVRGRYVSVERLLETGDGKTEWRMATSSTPGGKIPDFITRMSIPGQIAHDVPLFFKWYNSDKEYFKNAVAKNAADSGTAA